MIFKTPLFEIPIYKMKASRHDEIKQWMNDNVVEEYNKNGPNEVSRNLYSSYFPGASKLDNKEWSEFYSKDINSFMDKAGFSRFHQWERRLNFWYNLSFKGSYQEVHDHLGGPIPISYAAIHYVIFDSVEHTSTVFYNPLESVLKTLQPTTKDKFKPNDFQGLQRLINVEEGDLVFFPSYLQHSVMTQQSDKPRLTVAMNLSIYEKSAYE